MKRINAILTFFLALIILPSTLRAQAEPDSVTMGPGYANDIYYSFNDGVVTSVPRTNWDLGFQTMVWTATILTNGGNGTDLYTYPKADTSGWADVDTTGLSGWPAMYDSEKDWYEGAFNANQSGHPDYGWGKYNPISHDVVGDSIYIIKTADGKWRKIWILRKNSVANTYYIKYANLDGSDEQTVELNNSPYLAKNFVYFAFEGNSVLDREPDTASFDLLFTRYIAVQPDGTPYPVIGVFNNFDVYASEFYPVAPDFSDWQSMPFDSTKSPVGYDWKSFDFTNGWTVRDSLAYFVKTRDDEVYKLVFTGFAGTSSGKILFEKTRVSAASVGEPASADLTFTVSPNPIRNRVTLTFADIDNSRARIWLYDLPGRKILECQGQVSQGKLTLALPETQLHKGLHLLVVSAGNRTYNAKVMVE